MAAEINRLLQYLPNTWQFDLPSADASHVQCQSLTEIYTAHEPFAKISWDQESEISKLQDLAKSQQVEIDYLKSRMVALEAIALDLADHSFCETKTWPPSDPRLTDVVQVTQEMFGTPEIEVCADPEEPDPAFIVFTVHPTGSLDELLQRRIEWHERIGKIRPGISGPFRLSIVPKE